MDDNNEENATIDEETTVTAEETVQAPTGVAGCFVLQEVTRVLTSRLREGSPGYEQLEGLRVKAFATSKPPFGAATPMGSLEIVIANPDACKIFRDAPIGSEIDATFILRPKAPTA